MSEIVEGWKQVSKIVEKVKTIFRNCREIEFEEKWNQVSEIVEKNILVEEDCRELFKR